MRNLYEYELALMTALLAMANRSDDAKDLLVSPMNDGGMGSLLIGQPNSSRKMSKAVAQVHFKDSDGTLITAALNLDQFGDLFELDIWRVDFKSIQRWPNAEDIVEGA
jgi:hypothetical protein